MPRLSAETETRRGSMEILYNSDEFRMYCFKVLPCSKHYSHDWTVCPFAHPGEKARRRDPRVFKYAGVECPHVKEGLKCPRGDLCPFAHNIFECWLHPTRYRTQLCNEPASCKRKVCFFAHALEELRDPSNPIDSLPEGGIGSGTAPLMSYDGLGTPGPYSGIVPQQRQSIDIAQLSHMNNLPASPSLQSISDLMTRLQGINLPQNAAQQNQQLNLLMNLLAEIDLNGTRQQIQANNFASGLSAPASGIHRWSVDGHMMSSSGFPTLNNDFSQPMVPPGFINLSNQEQMMERASMENSIRDIMSQGSACHGRVSIDIAGLSRAPITSPLAQQQSKVDPRVSFKSIAEIPKSRSSDDSTNGSNVSGVTENLPIGSTVGVRSSIDCPLPEPFILF